MSRRNRKKNKGGSGIGSSLGNHAGSTPNVAPSAEPTTVQSILEDPKAIIDAANQEAWKQADESDLSKLEPTSVPEQAAVDPDLLTYARKAEEAVALAKLQRERALAAEEMARAEGRRFEEESDRLQLERDALDKERTELKTQMADLAPKLDDLKKRECELLVREEELKHQQLNAEAGFAGQRRESLAQMEAEAALLRKQLSDTRAQVADELAKCDKACRERVDEASRQRSRQDEEFGAELASRKESQERSVEQQQQEIEKRRAVLAQERGKLVAEQTILKEDRLHLQEQVDRLAAWKIEELEQQIEEKNERLRVAREDRDRYAKTLQQREEADRLFGHRTPEEVCDELKQLRNQTETLKRELAERPNAEASDRLAQLERDKENWELERMKLSTENIELKSRWTRSQIAVTEIETLRDEKLALESGRNLLHQSIKQLRQTYDTAIQGKEQQSAFPDCSAMDNDANLQERPRRTLRSIQQLKVFIDELQQRIAYDPATKKELYYSTRDLRCFLAGMAATRLHLLQGISGTGKTSLPLAFARAVGAGSAVISVQASWRDRQDLIGHFNAFERKFYETEFLRALYRAQCPLYLELPFIILLDEMNLSHPEQYFADVLSALELHQTLQAIDLATVLSTRAPQRLIGTHNGGASAGVEVQTRVVIPPNVWFVGTANHDETTKDFADKTYDRAHVMELPRQHPNFEINRQLSPGDPITADALRNAFEAARADFGSEGRKVRSFIVNHLSETLDRRFRIGWGNRLESHLEAYVPVVRASGGAIGEAADHIVNTKFIRKIRGRHDNRAEDIRELKSNLEKGLRELDPGWCSETFPEARSLRALQDELHRLGEED
jgi:hypothetical protein